MQDNRDSNEKKEGCHQSKSGHGMKHGLMMVLCCLVPLGLAFGLKAMGYGTVASYLAFLMCPLMHIFMMRGMHKRKDQAQDNAAP
ncbi:MAG TPA: DUF2933 domain-containing protein [Selenomonadales bacterium]|nr:DUF2933 domain-containing protein [Selenomonadales bacterium]